MALPDGALRKLDALAALPRAVLPYRDRLVVTSANQGGSGSSQAGGSGAGGGDAGGLGSLPGDGTVHAEAAGTRLSAMRSEMRTVIVCYADGRRTARDIAFVSGRSLYAVIQPRIAPARRVPRSGGISCTSMTTKLSGQEFSDQVASLVKTLRESAPDCVASGVVDMSTGMLLSYETVETHPAEVLDLLAGATLDLFQDRTVLLIENVFKERRGVTSDQHYFQEILVNSDNLTHLFIRVNVEDDIVAVVVCRKSVNAGMLFAQARRVVGQFGSL